MQHLLTILIALSLFLNTSFTIAQGVKRELVWSIIPYEPIHILQGEFKGKGVADNYLLQAQAKLPDYQHINQVMTPARAWYQIASKIQTICHPTAVKTKEREQIAYFSQPALITPVVRVLIREQAWQKYSKEQYSLNLGKYLASHDSSLGVVSERSYGEEIDQIIALAIRDGNNIVQSSGQYASRQLYEMLISGRIDMFLEYPWVTAYFDKVLNPSAVKLINLEIDDFPRYTPAYVACTKNNQGKQIIDSLNRFISTQLVKPESRQRMMQWLDKKEAKRFEKDYLEYFKIAH